LPSIAASAEIAEDQDAHGIAAPQYAIPGVAGGAETDLEINPSGHVASRPASIGSSNSWRECSPA
jgi:hypothetical protein